MKIITCASYYGTGSSVITDLFSEYSNAHSTTEFEFRFAHDPNGLMDLEYHLVENFNREGSGYALKAFLKFCKYNNRVLFHKKYCKFFDKKYLEYSLKYINSLTDFSYKGFWHFDLSQKGKIAYCFLGILFKLFYKLGFKRISVLPNEITYCSNPGSDKFLMATQEYTSNLLNHLNPNNKQYLIVDQLVPSTNTAKAMRYFKDEIFVFIVDRDPRDVYILCKTRWRGDRVFPRDSVEKWCEWFKYVRQHSQNQENNHILFVRFEDLVYKYEESIRLIESFVGIDSKEHIAPFQKFNPKKSVYNTQIFSRDKRWKKDIEIIEKLLPEYLYDFSSVDESCVIGIAPKSKKTF